MRDPDRIDPILQLLGEVWKQCPDQRLGQLIVNALQPKGPVPQIFYAEDDVLLEGLRRFGGIASGPPEGPTGGPK